MFRKGQGCGYGKEKNCTDDEVLEREVRHGNPYDFV